MVDFEVYSLILNIPKKLIWIKFGLQAYHNAFERKNYNPELTATDITEKKRNEKICTSFNGARTHFCTF